MEVLLADPNRLPPSDLYADDVYPVCDNTSPGDDGFLPPYLQRCIRTTEHCLSDLLQKSTCQV